MVKFFVRAAAIFAALLIVVPAGSALDAQTPAVVRVAAFPTDQSGNLYFALDLGYFKDVGLDVQVQTIVNAPAAATAMNAGDIDVAQANVTAFAAAHLRGLDFKLFAPAGIVDSSSTTDGVLVPLDSTVKTAADLNGKTMGIAAVKSLQQVLAMAWLDKHGGNSSTVKFVEFPFPQLTPALAGHRIDAAVTTEPFLTPAKKVARVIGNPDDGIAPRWIGVAFGAKASWLQTHQDVAARFAAALRRAGVWGNTHPSQSADILVKYSHMDPALMHSVARVGYAATLDPALIQPVLDASAKYGALDHSFPAAEIISVPKAAP